MEWFARLLDGAAMLIVWPLIFLLVGVLTAAVGKTAWDIMMDPHRSRFAQAGAAMLLGAGVFALMSGYWIDPEGDAEFAYR